MSAVSIMFTAYRTYLTSLSLPALEREIAAHPTNKFAGNPGNAGSDRRRKLAELEWLRRLAALRENKKRITLLKAQIATERKMLATCGNEVSRFNSVRRIEAFAGPARRNWQDRLEGPRLNTYILRLFVTAFGKTEREAVDFLGSRINRQNR